MPPKLEEVKVVNKQRPIRQQTRHKISSSRQSKSKTKTRHKCLLNKILPKFSNKTRRSNRRKAMRDNRRQIVRNLALRSGVDLCEFLLPRPNTIDSSKIRILSSKIGSFLAATKCIRTKSETCSILHSTRLLKMGPTTKMWALFLAIRYDLPLALRFLPNKRWQAERR